MLPRARRIVACRHGWNGRRGTRGARPRGDQRIDALDREAEASGATPPGGTFRFHCECGRNGGSRERLDDDRGVLDVVREQDDRFALSTGHENDELERVVDRTDRYVVVDKLPDAERFVADDPRRRPSR